MVNAGSARKEVQVKVFAISDLHLSGGLQKPMDVFGPHWRDHFARISEDWRARVAPEDLVLLPGDFCWAMQLSQAMDDLRAVAALPGTKVLLRGNHDFWWSSISRVRAALPEGMLALQNDAIVTERAVLCGTRGWLCPGDSALSADDLRVYQREVARLQLSLECAEKKRAEARMRGVELPLLAMLHFPAFCDAEIPSGFTELLEAHEVPLCIYGHLHGPGLTTAYNGTLRGVEYKLVSCDGLGFKLTELMG